MPKKQKLIEPIPATMQEIVRAIFANDPEPRDPEKEENFSGGSTCSSDHVASPPESQESQK